MRREKGGGEKGRGSRGRIEIKGWMPLDEILDMSLLKYCVVI